ncbi:MAG: glycosyltransferase family 2 protein [Clostridia bacterium]|nr:glycosyltransferase family 2 protein [Clostridia bacterium]
MKLSLVIPCYNEENNVEKFFEVSEHAFADSGVELEYVFVNDGSRDGTLAKLKKLYAEQNAAMRIVSFARNFGKEAAIFAGLQNATGELTCIIDADLQQRPEIALEMVRLLEQDPDLDCVAAFQEQRKEGKVLSFFKSAFYKVINAMTTVPFTNGASDFRTFRTEVKEAILQMGEYHRFSKGIFAWVGFNVHFLPYVVCQRESGESKWSFIKLFKYAIDGIVAFTTTPLHLPTVLGILCLLGSLIQTILAPIFALIRLDPNGIGFVVAAILFVGGLILLCLGVMGMYLSRVYLQVKDRPIYLAKEILTKEKEGK